MNTQEVIKLYGDYIMPTYTQSPIVLVKGEGSRVWDSEGKEYLDFFPGWAVSGLGHCHPKVVAAIRVQADEIIHVPNNYRSIQQALLAKKIVDNSFPGKVFFANSGAEANEAAIKCCRAFGNPNRYEIISMENSFHGRTMATVTMTGQKRYREGFGPMPEGFVSVPFNDFDALKNAVNGKTVGVIIELIQGEGGINVVDKDYLKKVRAFCNEKDILLIFDEVQTGMGRTGRLFAFQHFGVIPDLMTLAKTLGGGIPVGALVAGRRIADTLQPGKHASTFGGSPLVCAATLAVFSAIEEERLLDNVRRMGEYLSNRLKRMQKEYSVIKEVRGTGLMLGVELKVPGKPVVETCTEKGLFINCTHENVLRLMPALTVTEKQIDRALEILEEALGVLKTGS